MQRLHHLTFLVRVLGKKQSIGVFLSNKGNSIVFACFLGVIVIYLFPVAMVVSVRLTSSPAELNRWNKYSLL